MPVRTQLGAMCHLLLALCSIQMCLDLSMTLLGKLAVWLAHGALALRTFAELAIPHQAAMYCTVAGWSGIVRLFLSSKVLLDMAAAVEQTLAGAAVSGQTRDAAQKVMRHCNMHLSVLSSTWFAITDQSYARLLLPEWAVFALAECNYAVTMRMHASSLPGQSLYTQAVILQLSMVLLPWLYRSRLIWSNRWPQPGSSHPTSNRCESASSAQGMLSQPGRSKHSETQQSTAAGKGSSKCHLRHHVSVLGTALLPVCIKIDTPQLEPEHLPSNASELLANAFTQAALRMGDERTLLGMSVRRGCILIAVETLQPKLLAPAGPATAADAIDVLQLSKQLLPGLLRKLSLAADEPSLAQFMGPGTGLTLQQGTQVVQAKYKPDEGSWDVAPEPSAFESLQLSEGTVQMPTLGLIRPLEHVGSEAVTLGMDSGLNGGVEACSPHMLFGHATAARTTRHQDMCSAFMSQAVGTTSVQLEVPVACRRSIRGLRIESGQVGQHKDGRAGVEADKSDSSPDTFQLFALAEDGYLPLRVLSQTASADSTGTIIKVEVQLQPSSLVHHHQDGPCAVLQPLRLQLWCGKLLLSSSHTLLSVPAASATQSTAQPPDQFAWWCAPASVALAAVGELHAEVQRAAHGQDSMQPAQEADALRDLVRDICYWLSGVRRAAYTSCWCVGTPPASSVLGLQPLQLAVLYESLLQYAQHRGWASLSMLLQQQWQGVVKVSQCTATNNASQALAGAASGAAAAPKQMGSSMLDATWRQASVSAACMRVALLGRSCPQCELLAMQRLNSNLRPASVCLSFTALGISLAITVRQSKCHRYLLCWLTLAWGVLHLCMGITKLLTSVLPNAAQRSRQGYLRLEGTVLKGMQAMPLLAYVLIRLALVLRGSQWALSLQAIQCQHQSGTWVLMYLVISLTDRLALYTIFPQRVVTMLGAFDTLLLIPTNSQLHSLGSSILGALLSAVVAPLLVERYLQEGMASRHSSTVASSHPADGGRNSCRHSGVGHKGKAGTAMRRHIIPTRQ